MKQESVHGELDWYFSERMGMAGELSPPSIHAAQEAQSLSGAGSGMNAIGSASAAHDRMIRAMPHAARARAIGDVLQRLPLEQQLLLAHAHRDAIDARNARREFAELLGDVAPVVVGRHGRAHVRELIAVAKKDPARRMRIVELRLEVEREVSKAHFAFWQLACERVQELVARKRRRLTEALARRLAEVAPPVRLLTVEDLRAMGAIA